PDDRLAVGRRQQPEHARSGRLADPAIAARRRAPERAADRAVRRLYRAEPQPGLGPARERARRPEQRRGRSERDGQPALARLPLAEPEPRRVSQSGRILLKPRRPRRSPAWQVHDERRGERQRLSKNSSCLRRSAASGRRPIAAPKLSFTCSTRRVPGIATVTAGCEMMYLRKN